MAKAKNLYEQLSTEAIGAIGEVIGIGFPGPSFLNYLREVPPLTEGFTIGDAARAYLETRLAKLNAA